MIIMETQGITPVQIIQELLAMLTTRKEACEKIAAKPDAGASGNRFKDVAAQTDKYVSALQNELSGFGDAVMSDVDRNNEYHRMWKQVLEKAPSASAKELEQDFMRMENTLANAYSEYSSADMKLPESLSVLLAKQAEALKSQ
jgi:hypothetical protein